MSHDDFNQQSVSSIEKVGDGQHQYELPQNIPILDHTAETLEINQNSYDGNGSINYSKSGWQTRFDGANSVQFSTLKNSIAVPDTTLKDKAYNFQEIGVDTSSGLNAVNPEEGGTRIQMRSDDNIHLDCQEIEEESPRIDLNNFQ